MIARVLDTVEERAAQAVMEIIGGLDGTVRVALTRRPELVPELRRYIKDWSQIGDAIERGDRIRARSLWLGLDSSSRDMVDQASEETRASLGWVLGRGEPDDE